MKAFILSLSVYLPGLLLLVLDVFDITKPAANFLWNLVENCFFFLHLLQVIAACMGISALVRKRGNVWLNSFACLLSLPGVVWATVLLIALFL